MRNIVMYYQLLHKSEHYKLYFNINIINNTDIRA